MGIRKNLIEIVERPPITTDATAFEDDVKKGCIFYGVNGKMIGVNPMENPVKERRFNIVLTEENYPTLPEKNWQGDFGTGILINNNWEVHYYDVSFSPESYRLGGRLVFQLSDVNHLLSFSINGKKYAGFDNSHLYNGFGGDICAYERWDSSTVDISPKICIKRENNQLFVCVKTQGEFDFIFEYV